MSVPFSISVTLSHRVHRIMQSWSPSRRPQIIKTCARSGIVSYTARSPKESDVYDWLKQNESSFWGHWRKARNHFSETRIHIWCAGIPTGLSITYDLYLWITLMKFRISATRGLYFPSINKESVFALMDQRKLTNDTYIIQGLLNDIILFSLAERAKKYKLFRLELSHHVRQHDYEWRLQIKDPKEVMDEESKRTLSSKVNYEWPKESCKWHTKQISIRVHNTDRVDTWLDWSMKVEYS